MNRLNINLQDQAVVFRPDVFQPAYRALPYRVWRVPDDAGTIAGLPIALGRG